MAGTKTGGSRAATTNKQRYGDDFYSNIGRLGGKASRPERRPFSQNRELARMTGKKGAMARIATLQRRKEQRDGRNSNS